MTDLWPATLKRCADLTGVAFCAPTGSSVAASSPSGRVVLLGNSAFSSIVLSSVLDAEPGPVAANDSVNIATICADGTLRLFNWTTLAQTYSVDHGCRGAKWLLRAGAIAYVLPGAAGSIITASLTTGAEIARLDGILDDVAMACVGATSGGGQYLYCFDGRGGGRTVFITSAGLLTDYGTFDAQHCVNVTGALYAETVIDYHFHVYVTTDHLLIAFDVQDPVAPEIANYGQDNARVDSYIGQGLLPGMCKHPEATSVQIMGALFIPKRIEGIPAIYEMDDEPNPLPYAFAQGPSCASGTNFYLFFPDAGAVMISDYFRDAQYHISLVFGGI